MRNLGKAVPMIALCLLLAGCGGGEKGSADPREQYAAMTGCVMEASVKCDREGMEWEADLRCEYVPDGESVVEVLAPETIAGVKALFCDTDWYLEYGDDRMDIGTLSREELSPAVCLPRLIHALREGWTQERNEEEWDQVPCLRLSLDESGRQGGKIVSTVWLRQDDGTPLRGEIAVDGEIILTAEFTNFSFYDTLENQGA